MPGDLSDAFMALARSTPEAALEQLGDHVGQAKATAPAELSAIYRAAAIAARSTSRPSDSERYLDQALHHAELNQDDRARIESFLTRAGNMMLAGDLPGAITLMESLDNPGSSPDPEVRAQVLVQLATMYARAGRGEDAVRTFTSAETEAERCESTFLLAMTRKNRAMLQLQEGNCQSAHNDFTTARLAFEELDMELEVAFCDHNLGLTQVYLGDLPLAFSRFAAAERRIVELTGSDYESKVAHCRALLSVGLFGEASTLAEKTATSCYDGGLPLDGAEAQIIQATALLQAGETSAAATIANRAKDVFGRQDRPGHVATAGHIVALAELRLGHAPVLDDLRSTIETLRTHGFQQESVEASFVLAEQLGATDHDAGLKVLDEIGPALSTSPADLRIAGHTTRARLLNQSGRSSEASAAASDGYETVLAYQASLGSADLRAGVGRYTTELDSIGLASALSDGDPHRAFAWIERSHVTASLHRSVVPSENPALQSALAKRRAARHDDANVQRLEDDVRLISRGLRGTDAVLEPASTEVLVEALQPAVALSYAVLDGQLLLSSVDSGRIELHQLGAVDDVFRLMRSLRADLRRQAATGRSNRARVARTLGRLQSLLVPQEFTDASELVIAAPPVLFGVPWNGLPGRWGRPTSLATCLSTWARSPAQIQGDGSLLAAGPDLVNGDEEIKTLETVLERPETLTGERATVARVLDRMASASIAHLCCHGHPRADNPLFSELQLSDGGLSVYDIERLPQIPQLIVLSACHLGMPETTPGREMLGMATGLLSAGAGCVLASTLPVPDGLGTTLAMRLFHDGVGNGLRPAESWARAQQSLDDTGGLETVVFGILGRG